MKFNKTLFYILSFTWGLPVTLIGGLVALVLIIAGKKPCKYGPCLYFEVGYGWGGLEFGPIFLVNKNAGDSLKSHEFGHGLQNAIFGPFMILISTVSVIRYWYRYLVVSMRGIAPARAYTDIWFERDASEWGSAVMKKYYGGSQ